MRESWIGGLYGTMPVGTGFEVSRAVGLPRELGPIDGDVRSSSGLELGVTSHERPTLCPRCLRPRPSRGAAKLRWRQRVREPHP